MALFFAAQAGRKIEQKLAAAAGQQKLMVRVLKHKRWPQVLTNQAGLGMNEATDQSEQRAFAAAVTADKHPKSRSGHLEAAAIKCLCAAGPAVADPFKTQSCLRDFVI